MIKQIGNEKYLESGAILTTKIIRDKTYVVKAVHVACKPVGAPEFSPTDLLGTRTEGIYLVVPEGEHDEILSTFKPEDFTPLKYFVQRIWPFANE